MRINRHYHGVIPETRYAKSGDVVVAYQVTGEENPIDLVWAPGIVSHLDLDWEFPDWASFLRGLSSFARLIRFDKRGTGLSDRGSYVQSTGSGLLFDDRGACTLKGVPDEWQLFSVRVE